MSQVKIEAFRKPLVVSYEILGGNMGGTWHHPRESSQAIVCGISDDAGNNMAHAVHRLADIQLKQNKRTVLDMIHEAIENEEEAQLS